MTLVLPDTNVWLDYFLPARPAHAASSALIARCLRQGVTLLTTSGILKDLCFLLELQQKRWLRAQGAEPSERQALVAREQAHACTQLVLDNSTLVCGTPNSARMALKLTSVHPDFEDNLIVAAALHARADMLVTNDAQLLRHSPAPALSSEDALAWLAALSAKQAPAP